MIVSLKLECDLAHIIKWHKKKAGFMPAQKYKQDDKRLITELS